MPFMATIVATGRDALLGKASFALHGGQKPRKVAGLAVSRRLLVPADALTWGDRKSGEIAPQ